MRHVASIDSYGTWLHDSHLHDNLKSGSNGGAFNLTCHNLSRDKSRGRASKPTSRDQFHTSQENHRCTDHLAPTDYCARKVRFQITRRIKNCGLQRTSQEHGENTKNKKESIGLAECVPCGSDLLRKKGREIRHSNAPSTIDLHSR